MSREIQEETQIVLSENQVTYHGHRYARIPGWDYVIHIYQAIVSSRPVVQLDPKEHSTFEWVSIFAFKLMPLVKGQDEVFDILYADRIWQRVDPKADLKLQIVQETVMIVLKKGNKTLIFDAKKRFILNLIGTSGSGKGTQGEMLSKLYGVPNISAGDLFRDEFRNKESKLGWIVINYDQNHYPAYLPDEIPIGMMAKRLSAIDCNIGFILDGFPRTKGQGDATREVMLRKEDFHVPLFMDVPEADIWSRLPRRSICPECGHQVRQFDDNANSEFCPDIEKKHPEKKVKLEKRVEDVDKSKIERRLKMFADNKTDILSTMAQRDAVSTFSLNNTSPPREVLHLLCTEINKRLDELEKTSRIVTLATYAYAVGLIIHQQK